MEVTQVYRALKKQSGNRPAGAYCEAQWLLWGLGGCSIVPWLLQAWTQLDAQEKEKGGLETKQQCGYILVQACHTGPISLPVSESTGSLNGCQSLLH